MKSKNSPVYFFITIVILISFAVSQLEFPLHRMPAEDVVEFPFETFVTVDDLKNMETLKSENSTLLKLLKTRDDLYTIFLKLGTPSVPFEVIVDTGSSVLWVQNTECKTCSFYPYKYIESETASLVKTNERLENLLYFRNKISGEVCFESVDLIEDMNTLPVFKFLLVDYIENPIRIDGMLGLNRIYNDTFDSDFSFIESLYREGKIKKRIFSMKIEDLSFNSVLTVGELPKEISEDKKHLTKCKTLEDSGVKNSWACSLKQVLIIRKRTSSIFNIFRSNTPEIQVMGKVKPAIFDSGSNVIVAPELYFDIFRTIFFKEMIEQELCFIINDKDGSRGFECKLEVKFEDLPELRFVFENGFTYMIDIKNFFKKNHDKYVFRIIFRNIAGDVWILGQPFLKQYHMVFDMEDLTVGMYPLKNKGSLTNTILSLSEFESVTDETIDEDAINIHIYLAVLGCVLIILSLILFILVRKYKKSKNIEVDSERTFNLVDTEPVA